MVRTSIIDRDRLTVWLFLIDILVWGIFIAFIVFLVYDAYYVGYYAAQRKLSSWDIHHWHISRDVAIIVGCGVYIAIRQFKSEFYRIRRLL